MKKKSARIYKHRLKEELLRTSLNQIFFQSAFSLAGEIIPAFVLDPQTNS